MYTKDWFGDVDAGKDKYLFDCFIELNAHLYAMDYQVYSIVAFKGVGKTAFLKELQNCSYKPQICQLHCPLSTKLCKKFENYFVVPINVTEISFEALLNIFDKVDPRKEITNTLKAIVKIEFINHFLQYLERINDPDYQNLKSKIKHNEYKNKGKNITYEIIKTFERTFTKGENISQELSKLFLNNGDINDLFDSCKEILKEKNIYSIIVLDNFDIIMDLFKKENEAQKFYFHQTIATSLLELSYDEENTGFPNEYVQIKCLFPNDLYTLLHPRDLQKYNKHKCDMKWTKNTLNLFLEKRLEKLLETENIFYNRNVFKKFFPSFINNKYYKKQEDIKEYILRHTLFRPRDIQELMISITDTTIINKDYIKNKSDFIKDCLPFSQNNIIDGVRKGTYEIINYLNIEFENIKLENILQSLRSKKNIMSYSDLYDHLNKNENLDGQITITDYINKLYEIGIIGVLKIDNERLHQTYKNQKILKQKQSNENEDKYYVSIFSFSWHNNNIKLTTEDTIVIAPIFNDYLDLNVDKNYMIYPF